VESLPEGVDVLDYSGYSIAPGLVDTHIHGFGGVDVMDNNIEGTLHTMSEGLLSTGVTSFLPTTLTSSYEQLLAVTENIGSRYEEATGAKIRGIYFEGPYFTEKYKGAQNPAYMKEPSMEEFRAWQKAANGLLNKIALAPERACDILMKQKGKENVALITDCMTAGGLEDGDYMLGEFPVVVAEGTARLKSTGNLAGSILKLKDGLKNVVEWGIANPHEAVMMASL